MVWVCMGVYPMNPTEEDLEYERVNITIFKKHKTYLGDRPEINLSGLVRKMLDGMMEEEAT